MRSSARFRHWSRSAGTIVRIEEVEALEHFEVRLTFTDGTEKAMDLEPHLEGPIFEPLREDLSLFRSVRVDEELGTIVWPNGADMDPDVLYAGGTPTWAEESKAGS